MTEREERKGKDKCICIVYPVPGLGLGGYWIIWMMALRKMESETMSWGGWVIIERS